MSDPATFDCSILYVEDEPAAREELLAFLRRRARTVFAAHDGGAGLDLYRERRPDLVITDIRMPVLDGLEMAKAIKEIDPETKIVITSAYSDTPYLMTAIDAGVDAYVMKPVESTKLLTAIAKCAEVITARKTLQRQQDERQQLTKELQAALTKVKQLSGFLPICAGCKRIRNDAGQWEQIEHYLHSHSEAQFSHGMCPDCAREYFPGIPYPEKRLDGAPPDGNEQS